MTDDIDNSIEHDQAHYESEDEDECRVCRGTAEPGRILYSPCRCSGSIGLVHQDCLTSWLAVTRGDGRCELCSTKFKFAPRYMDGAPERLSYFEVLVGLSVQAMAEWVPYALRTAFVAALWLFLVPLITSYLYHLWMHRPSSIVSRMKWEFVAGDAVSGIVITAIIIVSFLSLMSFADFLRFHWDAQVAGGAPQRREEGLLREDMDEVDRIPFADEDVDDGLLLLRQQLPVQPNHTIDKKQGFVENRDNNGSVVQGGLADVVAEELVEDDRHGRVRLIPPQNREEIGDYDISGQDGPPQVPPRRPVHQQNDPERLDDHERNGRLELDFFDEVPDGNFNGIDEIMRAQVEQENRERNAGEFPREDQNARELDNQRFEPQFEPLDPVRNLDDGADMEINVALDELLGLQGPIPALIRNLLWFLLFIAVYLGVFAFIPGTIGSIAFSVANSTKVIATVKALAIFNATATRESEGDTVLDMLSKLNEESERLNTTLQLPDVLMLLSGYLALTGTIFFWRLMLKTNRDRTTRQEELDDNDARPALRPELRNEEIRGHGIVQPAGPDQHHIAGAQAMPMVWNDREHEELDQGGDLAQNLDLVLECAFATAKVGLLLFLKMLLLPLFLGIWLDLSTLALFDKCLEDRVLYAGRDLFGAMLLHWVAGITFMLIVTVSVLQLREVMHPDLLAQVIRPQEPQPDLLGNLLQDSASTHARRMIMSFSIYAALLAVFVSLPAYFLTSLGIPSFLPFLRPKISHIVMPQLQVPVELLIFHLSMLGFLEKCKNRIGGVQHQWLKALCGEMGLTEQVLPHKIDKFVLVGTKRVYARKDEDEGSSSNQSGTLNGNAGDGVDGVGSRIIYAAEALPNASNSDSYASMSTVFPIYDHIDPFWEKLAGSLDCKDETDHFILSNIELISNSYPVLEDGFESSSGQILLKQSERAIRLPSFSFQKVESFSRLPSPCQAGEGNGEDLLVPTVVGAYRLKRRAAGRGEFASEAVIEFWREVSGNPVCRPPEGWDDLEVGGAEVQGRWAWDKEKKSKIELSIARRTTFFRRGGDKADAALMCSKLLVLILCSWLGTTLLVCTALNFPLFIGRTVFFFLRVPDSFCHDPWGFAIGCAILYPIASYASSILIPASGNDETIYVRERFRLWLSGFCVPRSGRKFSVLLMTFMLWLVVIPLLVGTIYEMCLVKPRLWLSGEQPVKADVLLLSWGAGLLLIHCWASLCFYSAFKLRFWSHLLFGPPADHDDGNEPEGEGKDMEQWQGRHGRIGNFVDAARAMFLNWEWDKVDSDLLLRESTVPIAKALIFTLAWPSIISTACMHFFRYLNSVPFIQIHFLRTVDEALLLSVLFRTCALVATLYQIALQYEKELQQWFDAAHKAARDARYLVGEVLLNYDPS